MLRASHRVLINHFSTHKVSILHSLTDNIYFNLATEEHLYQTQLTNPTLFLWRNNKTIVVGRHQNPWKECHLQAMENDGVCLSRRITGGGAVYHDLGNTCFSFLTPYRDDQEFDYKSVNNEILLSSLGKMEIPAEIQGRNDITHDGKKISGSAYKLNLGNPKTGRGKKSLHHGTVLFNVDTNALAKYLNPNKAKLLSKGITSVAARVLNLQEKFPDANHSAFCAAAEKSFLQHYQPSQVDRRVLNYDELKNNQQINKRFNELQSWEWLYGSTPSFSSNMEHRFTWGTIDMSLDVQEGVIKNGMVYSDSLNPEFITRLNELFSTANLAYDFEGVASLEMLLNMEFPNAESTKQIKELCEWLKASI